MRRPLAALLLATTTLAYPQQKLVESVEVRVTNVDVVVTDKSGKPVTGLTQNDFEIFEDGKPQPITNFYEVQDEQSAGGQAASPAASDVPPEVRQRKIVVFIDNYSLHPFRRSEVFAAIDRSFDKLFRPGDQAMVAAWNRGLKVIVPFTNDREKLRRELKRYEKNAGAGAPREIEQQRVMSDLQQLWQSEFNQRGGNSMRDLVQHAESIARDYAQDVAANEKSLIASMSAMLTTLAGLEGKKVMLVAGSQLPARPGLEVFQLVDQMFGGQGIAPNAQRGAVTYDVTTEIEKLARQANANGVTLYMLDGGDTHRGATSPMQFADYTNTAQALNLIAQVTGGMALVRTNNFDLALNTMTSDLASYYSLGYKPLGEKTGDRKIVVKVKNPAYSVRSRTSYVTKSAEDQAEDRVIANAFHGLVASEFPVRLQTGIPTKHSETRWKVPVQITFPSDITLLPNGDKLEGGFTVVLVVVDDDGTMSNVTRRQQPVKLPKSALQTMRSKPISFTAEVLVSPGPHYISVGIVDDIANTAGYARARVIAH